MRRPVNGRVRDVLALGMLLLTLALSISHLENLQQVSNRSSLVLTTDVLSQNVQELERAESRATTPVAFAIWGQRDGQSVKSPDMERSENLSVLAVAGDTTLPLPGAIPLISQDIRGCLLDRESAYALFGDYNAVGGTLRWEGRDYLVRGIFDASQPTMVVNATAMADFPLNRLTLHLSENTSSRVAEEFLERHGLSSNLEVKNSLYSSWAGLVARLVPIWMAFGTALLLIRESIARRETPVIALLCTVAGVASLILFLWLAGFQGRVPQSVIPTRWSNFEFWQTLGKQWGELLTGLLYSKKDRPDILLLDHLFPAVLWGLLALAIYLKWVRGIRLEEAKDLMLLEASSLIFAFVSVLLVSQLGRNILHWGALWICVPLHLLLRWTVWAVRCRLDGGDRGATKTQELQA